MSPIPNDLGERIADLSEKTLTYATRMSGIGQRAIPLMQEFNTVATALQPYAMRWDAVQRLVQLSRQLCQLLIENGEASVDLGQCEQQLKAAYLEALELFYPTEPESPHDPQSDQPQDEPTV